MLDSLDAQVHGDAPGPELPPGVEWLRGDVRERQLVERALDGVEGVLHEAAVVGVGQSMYEVERYVSANTLGAAVLLDVIANSSRRPRKLLVASSMSIYGEGAYVCERCGPSSPDVRPAEQLARREWELCCPSCGGILEPSPTPESKPLVPTSVYAITKRDHEELFLVIGRAYGIPTVALRYFNTYGPGQSLGNPYTGVAAIFSSRLLNGHAPTVFEDGRQTRDFVHVSDVVQANVLALEADDISGIYNVGTGRATSVSRVAELLATLLRPGTVPEIVGRFRAGDIRHCVADIAKVRAELGYEPRVSLEDGLAELVRWVAAQEAPDRFEDSRAELEARGLTL